jgi:hypothetical protein
MALNDNFNTYNNNQNNKPTVNVTSGYRWYNDESTIDPTRLTAKMWGSSLQLELAPKKNDSGAGDFAEFDENNTVKIYLNHTKARMLYMEIMNFLTDPDKYSSSGVTSGTGLITISNGKEFGTNKICLIIRRLDPESGRVTSSFAYEFRTNYHYSIRNYKEASNDFAKEYEAYNSLELDQFLTLLQSYYEAMTNTIAFSVLNAAKHDAKMNQKIDGICESLGVQIGGGYKSSPQKSRSYFDKPSTVNANSNMKINEVSFNDLDSALNFED